MRLIEVISIICRRITLVAAAQYLSVAALSAGAQARSPKNDEPCSSRPVKSNCLAFNPAAFGMSNAGGNAL